MSRGYKNFQAWRKRVKARLVQAFGGSCGICGYDRCLRNLVFHHLDPAAKGFAVTSSKVRGWTAIAAEARKCVMLCANCHGEVHDGIITIPKGIKTFDEKFAVYDGWIADSNKKKRRALCQNCQKEITNRQNRAYCSMRCFGLAHRGSQKAPKLTAEQIIVALNEHGNRWVPTAREFGISDNGLRKIARKLGLPTTGLGYGPVPGRPARTRTEVTL